MISHWPIIAVIIAIANSWVLFWFKVYWDKRATATANPTKNQENDIARVSKRRLCWLALGGTILPVSGVLWVLIVPGITRVSVFFIFLFSVMCSVGLGLFLTLYILITVGEIIREGLSRALPKEK